MLKEFSIKNFKSINEEVTFSMEADIERVSEFPSHIVQIRDNSLLRVCSMYGPNGGGKSNILKALSLLKRVVVAGYTRDYFDKCSNAFSDDDTVEFTSFFATENNDIGYNVRFTLFPDEEIIGDGNVRAPVRTKIGIVNESVYVLNKSGIYTEVCSRDINGVVTSDQKTLIGAISSKPLGSSMSIVRFFYEYFYNENNKPSPGLRVLFELFQEISSIVTLSSRPVIQTMSSSLKGEAAIEHKDELIKLLNAADIPIKDIAVEKDRMFSRIYFVREVQVDENDTIERGIELTEESMGTQKIFDLLVRFIIHRNENLIYLGDDMNAFLHPKLMAGIIDLFNSNKENHSQLIFNSHDIVNMNNRVFRRDEIWFVYRNNKYQTNVVPLSNITNYKGKQIRNDASYSKQYLEGKYGADPFIKKGLDWNE